MCQYVRELAVLRLSFHRVNSLDRANSAHVHAQCDFIDSFYVRAFLWAGVDARVNESPKLLCGKTKELENRN